MNYIFYFIVTIGILVFIHEFGHFAAAKLCKIQTDVFAIGFGKRLFGWNRVNGFTTGDLPKDFDQKGHTDYRLSLLPLGGYVKISGMIDESFDTEFIESEPQPHEFRSKPTYQKLFVISAGVIMNLLLTIVLFWGINYFQGKQVLDSTQIGVIEQGTIAAEIGFETDDKITSVNGVMVDNWEQISELLFVEFVGKDVNVVVDRNGMEENLLIPSENLSQKTENKLTLPFNHTLAYISDVNLNSPAGDAGFKSGDIVLNINDTPVVTGSEVVKFISSNKDVDISVTLLRGEDTLRTTVNPGMQGKIGITLQDIYNGPIKYLSFGFFGSLTKSFSDVSRYTGLTLSMFKNVIVGNVEFGQVFGGPIKIAQFAAKSADTGITSFLYFLAMLSLSLAIINILPFPVLDGGHFVILFIEGVFRKELPIKVKIAIQNAGFVLLLLLMAFIIYSDIINM